MGSKPAIPCPCPAGVVLPGGISNPTQEGKFNLVASLMPPTPFGGKRVSKINVLETKNVFGIHLGTSGGHLEAKGGSGSDLRAFPEQELIPSGTNFSSVFGL